MQLFSTAQIRSLFIDYFKRYQHTHLPSSELIPHDDPSLLFTNSGMVQFKNIFIGLQQTDFKQCVTSQKCLRAGGKHNDLENVGYTARHHTFFEMLGNFSFGSYFKEKAIFYAWDFLTNELRLPKEKLLVTIYYNDEEAYKIWKEIADFPDEKIIRIATKDNFWEMGDSGPCGPCSEIFYDYGSEFKGDIPGSAGQDEGERYIEIWNLVFMQFQRIAGELHDLPVKCIDTGMGLERIAAVCQNVHDNFQIDLFSKLINELARQASVSFTLDMLDKNYIALRVAADHVRSAAFLIADGVMPGNTGANYVLKRIIRRACIYLYKIGVNKPILHNVINLLNDLMGEAYYQLGKNLQLIIQEIKNEEESFLKTIHNGFKQFEIILQENYGFALEVNSGEKGDLKIFKAEHAFKLYDTYGFPLDLTIDMASSYGMAVDQHGYDELMNQQKEMARKSWQKNDNFTEQNHEFFIELVNRHGQTDFVGYDEYEIKTNLIGRLDDQYQYSEDGKYSSLVFFSTPVYAESGGQASDQGYIYDVEQNKLLAKIINVKKYLGIYIHECEIYNDDFNISQEYLIKIDLERRKKIAANHSATHLLHRALKNILGEEVNQKGSSLNDERLRFDFNYDRPISENYLQAIEDMVNEAIFAKLDVLTQVMLREDALQAGATALFDEKYAELVRMVSINNEDQGEFCSVELCGGTHVKNTGDIFLFKIVSEQAIASGVRRIEAITGKKALQYLNEYYNDFQFILRKFNLKSDKCLGYIENLLQTNKEQEKSLSILNKQNLEKNFRELAYTLVSLPGELEENVLQIRLYSLMQDEIDQKNIRQIMKDFLKNTKELSILIVVSNSGKKNFNEQSIIIVQNNFSNDLFDKYNQLKANEILADIAVKLEIKAGGGNSVMASTGNSGHLDYKKIKIFLENLFKYS